jgi:hypothetical protein
MQHFNPALKEAGKRFPECVVYVELTPAGAAHLRLAVRLVRPQRLGGGAVLACGRESSGRASALVPLCQARSHRQAHRLPCPAPRRPQSTGWCLATAGALPGGQRRQPAPRGRDPTPAAGTEQWAGSGRGCLWEGMGRVGAGGLRAARGRTGAVLWFQTQHSWPTTSQPHPAGVWVAIQLGMLGDCHGIGGLHHAPHLHDVIASVPQRKTGSCELHEGHCQLEQDTLNRMRMSAGAPQRLSAPSPESTSPPGPQAPAACVPGPALDGKARPACTWLGCRQSPPAARLARE